MCGLRGVSACTWAEWPWGQRPEGVRVSGQDELRQLDEELAAGRVSAEEYRRRRDELRGEPPGDQPAPDPFPPPFSWNDDSPTTRVSAGGGEGEDAETTQVVHVEAEDDPERTQTVPGTAGHGPAGHGPQNPSYRMYQVPPWDQGELPPTTDVTPLWLRQGPEFERETSDTSRLLRVVGAVVLLAAITVGAYFLFRPDPGAGPVVASTTTGLTTTTPKEEPLVVALPGQATDTSEITTFEDVKDLKYLTDREIAAYEDGGADEAAMGLSVDSGSRIIVLVTRLSDETKARAATKALADLQVLFTLTESSDEAGVRTASSEAASGGPLHRAHYTSDRYVVRVQVQGQSAQEIIDDVLAAQLERLPADPAAVVSSSR